MLCMKGFKIIINEAEVVLAAIPDGILNFILALDNSGVLLFVGGIDPATSELPLVEAKITVPPLPVLVSR